MNKILTTKDLELFKQEKVKITKIIQDLLLSLKDSEVKVTSVDGSSESFILVNVFQMLTGSFTIKLMSLDRLKHYYIPGVFLDENPFVENTNNIKLKETWEYIPFEYIEEE